MALFKKNSILILLFLNKLFVLAYPLADMLLVIEEKTLDYEGISISLKIMADKNSLETQQDLLKYSEIYENPILLNTEAAIILDSECIDLNIFESFEVPTTLIILQVTDNPTQIGITKCEKEKIIQYSIKLEDYKLNPP